MLRARRRTSFRPPLIPPLVVGTAALISLAAAQLTAAAPLLRTTTAATDCATPGGAARAAGRHTAAAPGVAQRLDARGAFMGRSVSFSAAGRSYALDLPVDSSVSDRVGDALIYTSAQAGKSEIHVVDLATGCDAVIARASGVMRSAVLSPAADAVYVHGVSFPSRADAGVTRYGFDGSAQSALPALPVDARFGLTFGTQLGWSTDSHTLFVQSCAAQACRTRLLDPESNTISTFDAAGQGQIVGVTATHLVTYGACSGLPCAVLGVERASGSVAELAGEAWQASLDGTTVSIQTAAGIVEVEQ